MNTLSEYSIIEQIHSGKKSLVYRAEKEGKSVVIKTLQNEYPSISELYSFKLEYELLRKFNVDGIVKAISLEKYKNSYAIVFEDINGFDLSDKFKDNSKYNLDEVIDIAIKSAIALGEIHKLNIVHCDIKPQNIVLNQTTGQLNIIDFGSATLLNRQNTTVSLNKTLGYVSPEQTGRINRTIDYRTDFYSFGVTLYHLLTTELPFNYLDPMELVHAHIAKHPISPNEKSNIPISLSNIVMKLLQKAPEERYQSIEGLLYDLYKCKEAIETGGLNLLNNLNLKAGENDYSSKFQIPEILYGREEEINIIIESFKNVTQDNTEMLLISGKSGIGKSVLINEINKPIVEYKGYFISGKYDQFKKNMPYNAITQAFKVLILQLMTESFEALNNWKSSVLNAVGNYGKIIIDVIPELELLIGKQPSVDILSPVETKNRFNIVFQKFINVFSTKEHSLAIFLDDIQWADPSSIDLIQNILLASDTKYLMLILSYRDNEVLPTDPLNIMIGELKKENFNYKEIVLSELSIENISNLLADSLLTNSEKCIELAEILYTKTKGNPFFVNELLKNLYDKKLIYFSDNQWLWDIEKIRNVKLSENVIDLMTDMIKELPDESIEILKLAACIGDSFLVSFLILVADKSDEEINKQITLISNKGFLLINENKASFVHDKIREAVYTLISEDERELNHYKIGNTLLNSIKESELSEYIFNIVTQLNQGLKYINSPIEKNRLLELNLQAGKKALLATAYNASFQFFSVAIKLLPENSWHTDYVQTLDVYTGFAKAQYLTKDYHNAESTFNSILKQTKTELDKISVYELKFSMFVSQGRMLDVLDMLKKVLKTLKVNLPNKPNKLSVLPEIIKTKINLRNKSVTELYNLPELSDQKLLAILRLLNTGIAPAFFSQIDLFPILVLKMANMSIKHGNSAFSSYAYTTMGVIQGSVLGDYKTGYQTGKMAIALAEKFGIKSTQCRTLFAFSTGINPWVCHAREGTPYFQQSIQAGLEGGDLEYASYAINFVIYQKLLTRENLEKVKEDFIKYQSLSNNLKQPDSIVQFNLNFQITRNLLGESENPLDLNNEFFNENIHIKEWEKNSSTIALFHYYLAKCLLSYLTDNLEKAYEFSLEANSYEAGAFSFITIPEHIFLNSVICGSLYFKSDTDGKQKKYLKNLKKNYNRMKKWAENCPANFGHKFFIIEGLILLAESQKIKALEKFNDAVQLARENEYLFEESIANELIAFIWLQTGNQIKADKYIFESYYLLKKWGCVPKIKLMEEKYPQLKNNSNLNPSNHEVSYNITTSGTSDTMLDLNTVIKASQAISGEIHLGPLLYRMLKILLENAGAEKGLFILKENEQWFIEAEGDSNNIQVLQKKPFDSLSSEYINSESLYFSFNIVNYVIRTGTIVLLNNATNEGMFINDQYIKEFQPKSILCYPVLNQGNIIGVVYLENNITKDAFTRERLDILTLLSTQIAVSVEKSLMYENMEKMVLDRTSKLDQKNLDLQEAITELKQAQSQLVHSEKMAGLGTLVAGVAHEINNPTNFVSGITQNLTDNFTELKKFIFELAGDDADEKFIELFESRFEKIQSNLSDIYEGSTRIKTIVNDLRTFSRLDEAEQKSADVTEGITSSIRLIKSKYRKDVDFICDFEVKKEIECWPAQLNQVFMNIMVNACQAIQEKQNKTGSKEIGKLYIKTFLPLDKNPLGYKCDALGIEFTDDGIGMTEEVKNKIFDPFFTTKDVGSGTGMGMSISYSIIKKHRGKIEIKSEPDVGTTFILYLPFDKKACD